MRACWTSLSLVLALAVAGCGESQAPVSSKSLDAEAPYFAGPAFQFTPNAVGRYPQQTDGSFNNPSVARARDGAYALTWFELEPERLHYLTRAYLRIYSAQGAPLSPRITVLEASPDIVPLNIAAAMDETGAVAVLWSLPGPRQEPDNTSDLYLRRYARDGTPLGEAALVARARDYNYVRPLLVPRRGGGVIVAWQDYVRYSIYEFFPQSWNSSVHARFYGADGAPQGDVKTLVTQPQRGDLRSGLPERPALATAPDNSLILVYQPATAPNQPLLIQRFSAEGDPLGQVVRVNPFQLSSNTTRGPGIAVDAAGNFVVTWLWQHAGASEDNHFRRFSATAEPLGPPVMFGVTDRSYYQPPLPASVCGGDDGSYVTAWSVLQQVAEGTFEWHKYAQAWSPTGEAAGPAFRIGRDVASQQQEANDYYNHGRQIACDAHGNFVAIWGDLQQIGPGDDDYLSAGWGRGYYRR